MTASVCPRARTPAHAAPPGKPQTLNGTVQVMSQPVPSSLWPTVRTSASGVRRGGRIFGAQARVPLFLLSSEVESHASQNGTWTGGDLDGSAMEDVPKSAQQVSEDELLHHACFGVFWAHVALLEQSFLLQK